MYNKTSYFIDTLLVRRTGVGLMKLIADLHTHLAGRQSLPILLKQISERARVCKLTHIALTDHLPATANIHCAWKEPCRQQIVTFGESVVFLCGAEADIANLTGAFAAANEDFSVSELTLAAMHPYLVKPGTVAQHTQAFEAALLDSKTDILAHPMDCLYPFDEPYIVRLAARLGKPLEINALSERSDPVCRMAQQRLALLAKKYSALLAVSSDAQRPDQVGDFGDIPNWLDRLEIPAELVVNASEDRLCSFLKRRAGERSL